MVMKTARSWGKVTILQRNSPRNEAKSARSVEVLERCEANTGAAGSAGPAHARGTLLLTPAAQALGAVGSSQAIVYSKVWPENG